MRRLAPGIIGLILVGAVTATVWTHEAWAGQQLPGAVIVGQDAYMVSPQMKVATPAVVESAEWSSDGKYVLGIRQHSDLRALLRSGSPPLQRSLVLWKAEADKWREIWKSTGKLSGPDRVQWLPQTHVALVELRRSPDLPAYRYPDGSERRRLLARVDARRGRLQFLGWMGDSASIWVSPVQPYAAWLDQQAGVLRIINRSGRVWKQVKAPGVGQMIFLGWSLDGVQLTFGVHSVDGGQSAVKRFVVHLGTGQVTGFADSLQRPLAPVDEPPRFPYALRISRTTLSTWPERVTARSIWLASTDPKNGTATLVSVDSEWAKLSPNGDAVLYESDGAAVVRAIVKMPLSALLAVRRVVLMSNGKQLGLALTLYAQDHDGQLPMPGADLPALLRPYIQDPDDLAGVLTGFDYTFGGGALDSVAEPAATELGRIAGLGGSALVFVDGHVVWQAE